MGRQRKSLAIFLLLTLFIYIYADYLIDVELENIEKDHPWTGIRSIYRQNASQGGSLHLYENDAVTIMLCPDGPMSVSVENVSYSNDGMSDMLQLLETKNVLGTFVTYQHSNWGEYWNIFLSSDPLGKFDVPAQPFNITLFVKTADCFGVELDKIVLKVNKSVDPNFFICGYALLEARIKSECMSTKSNENSTMQVTTFASASVESRATDATSNVTISSSSTKPILTTKPYKPSNVVVKQKSSRTYCLDRKNIYVEFSLPNIVGTTIISRTDNAHETIADDISTRENSTNECHNVIWWLGHPDNSNEEFSSTVPNGDVDYTIDKETADAKSFPGLIQTDRTRKIVIRYTLGYNKELKGGSSVLFSLGLARLTKNINVGVQYYHRGKKNTKVYTNLLSPQMSLIHLAIPARTISPSLENQIHIYFPNASDVPIHLDFMRLDYIQNNTRSRNVILHEGNSYRIRGEQHTKKSKASDMSNEGMDVIIGKTTTSDVEKVVIYHRPHAKGKYYLILTIHENGEFYPYYENQKGNTKPLTKEDLGDVSGLIFAGVDETGKPEASPISRLEINPVSMDINVTFEDGSTLKLLVGSSTTDTKIVVNEASFPGSSNSTVSFVSTYVTDYVSTVNQVNVDGLKSVHILSEEINNIGGSNFTFYKSSPIRLKKTGQVFEIRFLPNA